MYYAATIIKNALSQCQGITTNPLNPSDICLNKIKSNIPNELLYVLHNICGDKKEDKIFSIAQDISASNKTLKMPKNVELALALKRSLRSKEYITLLNRFGHCISYNDALRVETAWANNVLSGEDGYATIPSNIQEGFFFQAAFDNGDYCQEYNFCFIKQTKEIQCVKI